MSTKGLDDVQVKMFEKIADTIRQLSIDAIQKANSGHPGAPLGCAELGAYLYGQALQHNPKNPRWANRDRFVLSAGHASMLLYSCLHLAGFDISLDDICDFRQLHSKTPGHPEFSITEGIEATTGPLGQGVANAVGMALGMKVLGEKFNRPSYSIFDSKVFCLAGDGDIMEGINHESCSFAGHFGLNNLILIYDANKITLDGDLSDSCSENVTARFLGYNWDVIEVDGHDIRKIHETISTIRESQEKPTLVIAHTIIGKGASKAGTCKVHGAPLGESEVEALRKIFTNVETDFYVPSSVTAFFSQKLQKDKKNEDKWLEMYRLWKKSYPEEAASWEQMEKNLIPIDTELFVKEISLPSSVSGRAASQTLLNALADQIENFIGGSADLSGSDCTWMKQRDKVEVGKYSLGNIKYGIREFGMAGILNGLAYMGYFRPFGGTFLVFSDYMRNAIRLAALSELPVIYQFTHDSVFLGEDGPTHQPVEHLMSLRAMPGLTLIRPADANEVKMAWVAALKAKGPVALILSRQNLPSIANTDCSYAEGLGRGAYIVSKEKEKAEYTLFATGSELFLATEVANKLRKLEKDVRVISMPCWELFEEQDKAYQDAVVGGDLGKRIAIEAGCDLGWYKYIGMNGIAITMDSFGASAPQPDLAEEFGFTVDSVLERIFAL
ncbi:Transketolase [Candidatus Clavichlamydia salmonicola]|uniref:transketolase n=1 Tax=Candidatus Clavichlamydia salmonicola TaxID=469812 RepID=UPI001890EBB3|nr:transketolase [Candidatus Clavichlamydia salmonicola]MBF5050506.1 Transketolase [Candidatus Clavichlamydia salmonicola]